MLSFDFCATSCTYIDFRLLKRINVCSTSLASLASLTSFRSKHLTWSLSKNLMRTSCFSLSLNSWVALHNSLVMLSTMVEHFLHLGISLQISIDIVVSKRVGELDFPALLITSWFAWSTCFLSRSCACL